MSTTCPRNLGMAEKQTIQQLMKSANVTQKELAVSLGISQAAISQILNPKGDPRLSTLRKISRELNISLETLAATYHDREDDRTDEHEN